MIPNFIIFLNDNNDFEDIFERRGHKQIESRKMENLNDGIVLFYCLWATIILWISKIIFKMIYEMSPSLMTY